MRARRLAGALLVASGMIQLAWVGAAAAPRAILLRHDTVKQEHLLTCEVAALRSALTARRIQVTEASLLSALPVDPRPMRLISGPFSGYAGGPDPFVAFAGSVDGHEFDGTGYGVYDPPVAAVGRGTGASVSAGEGIAPSTLYAALFEHRPSVVWAQNPLRPVAVTRHYTADDGRVVPYAYPEHAYALVGADLVARTVVLMNPLEGTDMVTSMADFEASFAVFGDMAVTVGGGSDAGTLAYPAPRPLATATAPASTAPTAAAAGPRPSANPTALTALPDAGLSLSDASGAGHTRLVSIAALVAAAGLVLAVAVALGRSARRR